MSFDSLLLDFQDWLFHTLLAIAGFLDKCQWMLQNWKWGPTKKDASELYVEVWEISIADGLSGAIRGSFHKIKEFYFPELNFSHNTADGKVNYLLDANKRYQYKTHLFYKDSQPRLLEKTTIAGPLVNIIKQQYANCMYSKNNLKTVEELSGKVLSDLKLG